MLPNKERVEFRERERERERRTHWKKACVCCAFKKEKPKEIVSIIGNVLFGLL
jgi:hypothetical protein